MTLPSHARPSDCMIVRIPGGTPAGDGGEGTPSRSRGLCSKGDVMSGAEPFDEDLKTVMEGREARAV